MTGIAPSALAEESWDMIATLADVLKTMKGKP